MQNIIIMNIQEFIQKTSFNDRDTFSLIKMYSDIEKTESEWIKLLKKDFDFVINEKTESKITNIEKQNLKK